MIEKTNELLKLSYELERQKSLMAVLASKRDSAEALAAQLVIKNAELLRKSVDYVRPLKSLEDIRLIRDAGDYDKNLRQVLVIGYYGEDNYGDELMLQCLLKRLRRDGVQIWIGLFPAPHYCIERWKGCRCLYLPKTEEGILDCAVFFDELVLGGGAHIDDIDIRDPSFIPYLARRLSILMLRRAKTVRWIAVSANRCITNCQSIRELNEIVREGANISVRDRLSLETLRSAGVNVEGISLVDDPAFELDAQRKTLLVILAGLETQDRLETVVKDLISFCRTRPENWELCFVPFLNVRHYDLHLIEQVCKEINFGDILHYCAPEFSSIESMTLFFKAADLVFSMKYHASLLALLFGKPLVTYCLGHRHYYNKMHTLHERFQNDSIIDDGDYSSKTLIQKLYQAKPEQGH